MAAKLSKEIRPVFHEELDFFGMDEYWDYPKDTDEPLLWAEGIRRYVMNGVPVAEAKGGGFYTKPVVERLTEERLVLRPVDVKRLYDVNRDLMLSLEQKAVQFIRKQYERYKKEGYAFVCAFSGGKDSLVLLDLCAKALAPGDFYVIFSNTGMELSDTLKAVERAKERYPELRFAEAKCHMSPQETWEEFGPPGRRMRWCCSVHKSVPTILKLRELIGKYNVQAVVYDGVRAEESARRAKYGEISERAKNISQINASPIHKWNTPEIYCYLLANDLLLNNAYRLGLFRVGCMVCPLSSEWWDGLANAYYADEMRNLLNCVESYAKRTKPEKEVKKYVEDGGWKARMGGRGLLNGGNRVVEQVKENSLYLTIKNPTQKWSSVAPILGTITEQNENYGIQHINELDLEFTINYSENAMHVMYKPLSNMDRFCISHLRGVAYKTAYCRGCKACIVQCPTGAFTIQAEGNIFIRQSLCIHCANCLTFSEKSCLIAKSLSVTNGGGLGMNLKGLNPYQHFGFRQAWLEHFIVEGLNCFSQTTLGNRQYEALRVWLKESGILIQEKRQALMITPLGEKLIKAGSYNPFTWAIIWANLSYNSTISRWYCLNAAIGTAYEKSDLVVMLGDGASKSSRDNAVTALTETFRNSPIGSTLKQGIPIDKAYLRAGWDYPDSVALLYALYLYAERTGHKSFTFSELIASHKNPEATGISPHDIYGIDAKAFREHLQGLATQFPKYIRVSFVANLENIVLEDFSSLDILDLAGTD